MVGNVDRCGLHSASVLEHMGNHQWPLLFSKKLSHEIRPITYSLYVIGYVSRLNSKKFQNLSLQPKVVNFEKKNHKNRD